MTPTVAAPIILIGPMSAGKSTVAKNLAKLMALPNVPMDRVRWYYYLKEGFSISHEDSLTNFEDKIAYWKPFEVKAVRRIVTEFPDAIIDFGAGHSFYTNPDQFKEVAQVLAPLKNVFLLLPSQDKAESLRICNQRLQERNQRELEPSEIKSNKEFIEGDSNYKLAKQVVYNKNESPLETASRIKKLIV